MVQVQNRRPGVGCDLFQHADQAGHVAVIVFIKGVNSA
jgi:hypothetical protein